MSSASSNPPSPVVPEMSPSPVNFPTNVPTIESPGPPGESKKLKLVLKKPIVIAKERAEKIMESINAVEKKPQVEDHVVPNPTSRKRTAPLHMFSKESEKARPNQQMGSSTSRNQQQQQMGFFRQMPPMPINYCHHPINHGNVVPPSAAMARALILSQIDILHRVSDYLMFQSNRDLAAVRGYNMQPPEMVPPPAKMAKRKQ